MNLVTLSFSNEQRFFCPMTGVQMLGRVPFQESPATLFVYIDEIGDVESEDGRVNALWSKLAAENESLSPTELLKSFLHAVTSLYPNLVVFQLDDTEAACGPVASTVFLGINFDHGVVDENARQDGED